MSAPNRRFYPPGMPQSHGPATMIVKRDGRAEPFDRNKIINSIRNAGATPREANLVTDRVTFRFGPRTTVPSTEVSSMVARSLSHVNPVASQNYVGARDQKLAYNQRVSRLSAEIAAINQQVNSAAFRVESLGSRIQGLPGRIARIRQANYRLLTSLEGEQTALSEEWSRTGPDMRMTTNLKGETVRAQAQTLQKALTYRAGIGDYNASNLQEIEAGIPQLRTNLSEMNSSIISALSPMEKNYENIDQDLTRAENTISNLEGAAFPWEESETPVLAIRAKDLNSSLEGVITLTNLKFVFEHLKEVVLKKTLFVVTEKKTVRETKIQKPIGMVTEVIQGKVGFFKGAGLFVKFASEAGIPEMKFDTTGEDAEWVTKSYGQIISGQIDKELATSAPATAAKVEERKPQLVTCPVCGAPYTEKVFRGQTSVNCKYCGALVSLQK